MALYSSKSFVISKLDCCAGFTVSEMTSNVKAPNSFRFTPYGM